MSALLYDMLMFPLQEFGLRKIRCKLLSGAHGKTLEIGVGTGLNLPHYASDVVLTAIDTDEAKLARAQKRATGSAMVNADGVDTVTRAEIRVGDAQELDFPDSSFDSVVATLVFCSIPDPDKALKEVRRVLKPGGNFYLLEHVKPERPALGKVAELLTPIWCHVCEGCHLNRDPEKTLTSLGFKALKKTILWGGIGKLWVLQK